MTDERQEAAGPWRLRASWEWTGLRFFGLALCIDGLVVRSGDEGIERGADIDIALGWLMIQVNIYRVCTRYRTGELTLDALRRVTEPLERWINTPPIPASNSEDRA
jgi:hypothetical protein